MESCTHLPPLYIFLNECMTLNNMICPVRFCASNIILRIMKFRYLLHAKLMLHAKSRYLLHASMPNQIHAKLMLICSQTWSANFMAESTKLLIGSA